MACERIQPTPVSYPRPTTGRTKVSQSVVRLDSKKVMCPEDRVVSRWFYPVPSPISKTVCHAMDESAGAWHGIRMAWHGMAWHGITHSFDITGRNRDGRYHGRKGPVRQGFGARTRYGRTYGTVWKAARPAEWLPGKRKRSELLPSWFRTMYVFGRWGFDFSVLL